MTVAQLIRDLNELPTLSRVYIDGSNLVIGKNWMIRLETKLDRQTSEIYENQFNVKQD